MKQLTADPTLWKNRLDVVTSGEPRTAYNSIEAPMQILWDNANYLKKHVDDLETGATPARRLRTVASVAAAKALTWTLADDGQHLVIRDLGLYEYRLGSALPADDVIVISVTGGRLVHMLYTLRGTPYGVAGVDASGKLLGSRRVLNALSAGGVTVGWQTSALLTAGAAVVIPDPRLIVDGTPGQTAHLTAHISATLPQGGEAFMALAVSTNGGATWATFTSAIGAQATAPGQTLALSVSGTYPLTGATRFGIALGNAAGRTDTIVARDNHRTLSALVVDF